MKTTNLSNQEVHRIHQAPATLVSFIICLSLFAGLFRSGIWDKNSNDALIEQFRLKSIGGSHSEQQPESTSGTSSRDWKGFNKSFTNNDSSSKNSIKTFLVTQESREQYPTVKTTCSQKLASEEFLCKNGYNNSCYAIGPSDVIETFWAVAPVYCYTRDQTDMLYEFHNDFRYYIESIGLSFCTIEGIRKDLNQTYKVTKPGREPYEIQITIYDEDYIRENMLNVALKKIPGWEYVTWIDAHQMFENIYWWEESIVKMEKHCALQPYKNIRRLHFDNSTWIYGSGAIAKSLVQTNLFEGPYLEVGNAMAVRREMYEAIGGILDVCIASTCDVSYVIGSIPPEIFYNRLDVFPNYVKNLQPWIDRVKEVFKGNRAIIRGTLSHRRHMKYFKYVPAVEAFDKAHFNYTLDTMRDENGTIKITNPQIRELIPNLKFSYFT